MNKLLAICIMCLVFISTADAEYFKATKIGNIRSGPGTTYNIVGQSDPVSDEWNILKIEGSWIKISETEWIYISLGKIITGQVPEPYIEPEIIEEPQEEIQVTKTETETKIKTYEVITIIDDDRKNDRRNNMIDYLIPMSILAWILFWIVPSYICSVVAEEKGRTKWGFFFFSLVFTPILGFLAVIAFPVKRKF